VTLAIVLADDHPVMRRGMRALLDAEPEFSVVGEAGDGLEAVRLCERLGPDVLVLDLMMPSLNGLEALRIVRERAPRTRVVIQSMHSANSFVVEALKNGATGYVIKSSAEEDLVRAVRAAADGTRFLSAPLTERAIAAYIEQSRAADFDPHETLTAREREVLQLAAEGKTSTAIAARLHLSHRTVENHRANLMRKLGIQNQTELVRYALRRGLIPLED
jgi:two-component system, NarL family, response regulator NreC